MLQGYDVLHGRGGGVIQARLSGRRFIGQAVGTDLRWALNLRNLRGVVLRHCFRSSQRLLVSRPDLLALVPPQWPPASYIPVIVNTDFMAPGNREPDSEEGINVFHPSLHDWTLGDVGSRRNQVLLHGFARFIRNGHKGTLVTAARGASWEASRNLIEELGLTRHTKVVGDLNQESLRENYRQAHVVADHFSQYGVPGLCTLDAMACARPAICSTNMDLFERVYGEAPPLFSCTEEQEVYEALVALVDPNIRSEIGRRSRKWVQEKHGWPVVGVQLLEVYNEFVR